MVRSMEKLIKIEHPTEIPEMKLETLEVFPTTPTLELMDIDPHTGPEIICQIDLGLDQLEDHEE
ncbi:hypothetical protein ACFLRN_00655 [Thermoproteota archaeon]